MALADKITKGKIVTPQKLILYGVAGIGKTTLINEGCPSPIFIDTENGSNEVAVERIRANNHKELFEALKDLYHDKHDYRTVVLDSIDWAEKFLERKVCEAGGVDGVACNRLEDIGGGWGKGKGYLREEFQQFLFKLDAFGKKGINVVLIGHSEVIKFQPPGEAQGYDRYVLRLDKENAQNAIEWAGTVLFADYKTYVVEQNQGKAIGIGGKERILYTTHSPAFDAKNRFSLEEKSKFEVATLAKVFGPVTRDLRVEQDTVIQAGNATVTFESPKTDNTPLVGEQSHETVIPVSTATSAKRSITAVKPDVAAEELTNQSVDRKVDESVSDFIEATLDLDAPQLVAFLKNRERFPESGNLIDLDVSYAKMAMSAIDRFKETVRNFQA